jgi:hypothetical protein
MSRPRRHWCCRIVPGSPANRSRCRKQSDTGNRIQASTDFALLRGLLNQRIGFFEPYGQLIQLQLQLCQQQANRARQLARAVFQNPWQRGIQMASTLPQSNDSLQQQATNLVDHCSTTHHPALAHRFVPFSYSNVRIAFFRTANESLPGDVTPNSAVTV